jgi:threonine/homoserine/homoserine lactone efflux protein
LAVVIAQSATAFTLVKWIGAAYLMYLGIQALRTRPAVTADPVPDESKHDSAARSRHEASVPRRRLFRDGFWVALLNPKTALFFAALLPQFIVPGAAPLQQTWVLGSIFVAVAMCTDTAYVLAAVGGPRSTPRLPR